ncbi:hypothetical protein HPULCUR_009853 [Helicostylum pulchrum]|uniref:Uncharacterized protein n=1 Tax=Helicostylum pulchrum TaxID=562976 RepID=A0ABP9YCL0_9FUNG
MELVMNGPSTSPYKDIKEKALEWFRSVPKFQRNIPTLQNELRTVILPAAIENHTLNVEVIYFDGHEREDVVTYRKEWSQRIMEYQRYAETYGYEDVSVAIPPALPDNIRLISLCRIGISILKNEKVEGLSRHSYSKLLAREACDTLVKTKVPVNLVTAHNICGANGSYLYDARKDTALAACPVCGSSRNKTSALETINITDKIAELLICDDVRERLAKVETNLVLDARIKISGELKRKSLAKNAIFDTTNASPKSQIKLLPPSLKNVAYNIPYIKKNAADDKISSILNDNDTSVFTKLKKVKNMKVNNKSQRMQQEVCRFIIVDYSEEEEVFYSPSIISRWGDTVPDVFKDSNISPKVDLRIFTTITADNKDDSLAEFAKIADSTKMYNDKLKLALTSKFHLNHLLKSNIRLAFLFIMIMGFGFFFYCLDFENGMYVIKEIDKCCFPISKNYISQKGILDLFDCINNVKTIETMNDFFKSQYFYLLSKNLILDTTDDTPNSQMKLLPSCLSDVAKTAISYITKKNTIDTAISNNLNDNNTSLSKKLETIATIKTSNKSQRIQQEVCRIM